MKVGTTFLRSKENELIFFREFQTLINNWSKSDEFSKAIELVEIINRVDREFCIEKNQERSLVCQQPNSFGDWRKIDPFIQDLIDFYGEEIKLIFRK